MAAEPLQVAAGNRTPRNPDLCLALQDKSFFARLIYLRFLFLEGRVRAVLPVRFFLLLDFGSLTNSGADINTES